MGSRNLIWRWRNETIWGKYCGFLDLTKEEFHGIQRELLQDELLLVHRSPLGQSLLQGSLPKNIGDFRRACRLTTYRDYRPFLENHQDSSLSEPAHRWADSDAAGRESRCVPYTKGLSPNNVIMHRGDAISLSAWKTFDVRRDLFVSP